MSRCSVGSCRSDICKNGVITQRKEATRWSIQGRRPATVSIQFVRPSPEPADWGHVKKKCRCQTAKIAELVVTDTRADGARRTRAVGEVTDARGMMPNGQV